MAKQNVLVAVVEPPSFDDAHWIVSAPAINYSAQGDTRREALRIFEEGLEEAYEWALENGADPVRTAKPEVIEYEL